ncbi:serine/threonine-protein kinase [Pseudoalteromonas gelatinilytica]|nr:serine/threonine-protein kinase [Pseudoalteromonas profundi]
MFLLKDYYKQVQVLAQGGMSTIYLATDVQLNRQVVLKVMKLQSDNVERAITEAQLIASFNHQNIVQLYRILHEDELVLLEMEYIKGTTLANLLRERQLSVVEKIEILSHISDGLAGIHEKEILHLDLKPANVLISENGAVKIADFGISKIKHKDTKTHNTSFGSLKAMSPEQLNNEKLDFRSDLFSLGLIAYQLFCDVHAYANQASSAAEQDIAAAIKSSPCRANYESIYTISPDLAVLIKKLLAFKPENRPTSASFVAAQFKSILATLSFDCPTIEVKDIKKQQNINKRLMYLIGLTVCFGLLIWTFLVMQTKEYVALLPIEYASTNAVTETQKRILSLGINDAVTESLLGNRHYALISEQEIKQTQLVLGSNASLSHLASALGASKLLIPLLDCSSLSCDFSLSQLDENAVLVNKYRTATDKENYLNIYNSALSSVQSLLNLKASKHNQLSLSDKFVGEYVSLVAQVANNIESNEAEKLIAESLLFQRADFKPLYPLYRKIMLRLYKSTHNVALIKELRTQLDNSPVSYRESPAYLIDLLEIYQHAGEHTKANQVITRIQDSTLEAYQKQIILSIYYKRIGDLERALKHAQSAYALRPTLLATRNLAIAYLIQGKRDEAVVYLKEVLRYSPEDIVTLKTLADISLLSGELEEAQQHYQKLIDSGQQSPSILSNFSIVLSLQGELEQALKFAERAMSLEPETSTLQLNYADLLYLKGYTNAALELYKKINEHLGTSPNSIAEQLEKAQVLIHLEQNQQAMNQIEEVLITQPDLAEAYFIKAMLQSVLNEKYSAMASIEQSIKLGWSPVFYRLEWFKPLCSENKLATLISQSHYLFLCKIKSAETDSAPL